MHKKFNSELDNNWPDTRRWFDLVTGLGFEQDKNKAVFSFIIGNSNISYCEKYHFLLWFILNFSSFDNKWINHQFGIPRQSPIILQDEPSRVAQSVWHRYFSLASCGFESHAGRKASCICMRSATLWGRGMRCSLRAFLREPPCGTCKKDQAGIWL